MTAAFLAAGTFTRGAGGQPARRRRALLRHLRDLRRQAHVRRRRWSRSSTTLFVELLGIKDDRARPLRPRRSTDELRELITEPFATRTQAEWAEVFEGTDACVAAVIPISEAEDHPHLQAREVYVEHDGLVQPAPAPRFSRTTPSLSSPPSPRPAPHTREALAAWGIADVDGLIESGAAVQV